MEKTEGTHELVLHRIKKLREGIDNMQRHLTRPHRWIIGSIEQVSDSNAAQMDQGAKRHKSKGVSAAALPDER